MCARSLLAWSLTHDAVQVCAHEALVGREAISSRAMEGSLWQKDGDVEADYFSTPLPWAELKVDAASGLVENVPHIIEPTPVDMVSMYSNNMSGTWCKLCHMQVPWVALCAACMLQMQAATHF